MCSGTFNVDDGQHDNRICVLKKVIQKNSYDLDKRNIRKKNTYIKLCKKEICYKEISKKVTYKKETP